jgi:hypothetical protein
VHCPVAADVVYPAADGRRNGSGDLVLQSKNVEQFPIIALSPQMIPGFGINELGSNPEPLGGPANAAFDNIGDTELTCDVLDFDRLGSQGN